VPLTAGLGAHFFSLVATLAVLIASVGILLAAYAVAVASQCRSEGGALWQARRWKRYGFIITNLPKDRRHIPHLPQLLSWSGFWVACSDVVAFFVLTVTLFWFLYLIWEAARPPGFPGSISTHPLVPASRPSRRRPLSLVAALAILCRPVHLGHLPGEEAVPRQSLLDRLPFP